MNDDVSAGISWPGGGYVYLRGGAYPFSNGVAAAPGHALTRVRLRVPRTLGEGLALAADFLVAQERPPAAFAACELRAPAPMSPVDFAAFNAEYRGLLRANGFGDDASNPIARSNLAPLYDPPAAPTLFAFTYSVPTADAEQRGSPDFVISGLPELVGDPPAVVAPGDVSATGMQQKAAAVIAELQRRVARLGAHWRALTATQIYTVHSLDAVRDILAANGMTEAGLTLFPSYPPVTRLDFEIDVRAVSVERVIP